MEKISSEQASFGDGEYRCNDPLLGAWQRLLPISARA